VGVARSLPEVDRGLLVPFRKATMGRDQMAPRTDRTTRIPSGVASLVTTNHAAKGSVFVNVRNGGNLNGRGGGRTQPPIGRQWPSCAVPAVSSNMSCPWVDPPWSVHRKDQSVHRKDASVHRKEESVHRKDQSVHRKDQSVSHACGGCSSRISVCTGSRCCSCRFFEHVVSLGGSALKCAQEGSECV